MFFDYFCVEQDLSKYQYIILSVVFFQVLFFDNKPHLMDIYILFGDILGHANPILDILLF